MRFKAFEKNWLKISRAKTKLSEFNFKNESGENGIDNNATPEVNLLINKIYSIVWAQVVQDNDKMVEDVTSRVIYDRMKWQKCGVIKSTIKDKREVL